MRVCSDPISAHFDTIFLSIFSVAILEVLPSLPTQIGLMARYLDRFVSTFIEMSSLDHDLVYLFEIHDTWDVEDVRFSLTPNCTDQRREYNTN